MDILNLINASSLYRPWGLPRNIRQICLLTCKEELRKIESFLAANPQVELKMIIILDMDQEAIAKIRIMGPDNRPIPVMPSSTIITCPELTKVFLCPASPVTAATFLTHLCRFYEPYGLFTVYFQADQAPAHTLRSPLPDYFAKNAEKLAKAAKIWSDGKSLQTFIGRIKAILTGNSGYIPIAGHQEYFHPAVHPDSGDIMIDGGISDMVGSQREFLEAVGENGHVYGFEPIPELARSADRQLSAYPGWSLECAGLAEKPGTAIFDDLRDSSRISQNQTQDKAGTIKCALDSIDNFCSKKRLNKINLIKLDIEGAELAALKGAEHTIKTSRPRLIICLYHKPEDMYEIPLYLVEVARDYKFYLAHSSCQFMDTILYAIPAESAT